jgi:drug/metabolite transporter (DMT)-like permease
VILGFLTALAPAMNNMALMANAVGFTQLSKVIVTPVVVIIEYLWLGKTISRRKVLCLVLACVGVLCSGKSNKAITLKGWAFALMAVPPSAAHKVYLSRVLQRSQVSSLGLILLSFPMGILLMLPVIPFTDDLSLSFTLSLNMKEGILLSGFLAALLHVSAFLVISHTSAMGHVLVGQLKSVALVVLGELLFKREMNAEGAAYAALAIGSITMYAVISVEEDKLKKARSKRSDEEYV